MQRQRNAFPAHRSRSAKFLSSFGTKNRQGTACPAEKSNISAEEKSENGLSTCSILPEENEEQVAAILKTGQVELQPIAFPGMETLPLLPSRFAETLCVCPDTQYEGFFVAKLRKKANG